MVRVCVVGAGRAGVEAAAEAARKGADVTLLEKSDRLLPHRSTWPDYIRPHHSIQAPSVPASLASVDVVYEKPAVGLRTGSLVTSDGEVRFDRVVMATGSRQVFRTFLGFTKTGIIALDSLARFVEMGRRSSSLGKIVVCGGGPANLRVADVLSGDGSEVTLVCPGGKMLNGLHSTLDAMIRFCAKRTGIRVVDKSVDRALGSRMVEAVLAGGEVIPCDLVAVTPYEEPMLPHGCPPNGAHGGLMVGPELRSPLLACYAAGGCAEFSNGGSWSVSLKNSAPLSGRTAGANAAGSSLAFCPIGMSSGTFFGLQVSWAGLGLSEARFLGLEARQTAAMRDETSGSSLVYDRNTGRVIGIQTVEKSDDGRCSLLALLIAQRISMRALAYCDIASSSDISLLSEAARQGLSEEAP